MVPHLVEAQASRLTLGVLSERAKGSEVIVEKYAPGGDYRVLVVGDRVVAASRRRTLLERAWYLPLGFDQSPGEVPPLESLLVVDNVASSALIPRIRV